MHDLFLMDLLDDERRFDYTHMVNPATSPWWIVRTETAGA